MDPKDQSDHFKVLYDRITEQQVDLTLVNNMLSRKISHQNFLIDFLNQTRFILEKYTIFKYLFDKLCNIIGHEYAILFEKSSEDHQHILSFTGSIHKDYRVIFNKQLTFNNDFKLFQLDDRSISFYINGKSHKEEMKILEDQLSIKIHNITVIPLLEDEHYYGQIFLLNSVTEHRISQDNLEIFEIIQFNMLMILSNIGLYKASVTDELTQIYNKRYFSQRFLSMFKLNADNTTFSLIILDIDHFKKFNDTYGHQVGDIVLKHVASTLVEQCRNYDLPARYGGEEFVVLLPSTESKDALMVAERIRKSIESMVITHDQLQLKVTASLGVANFPAHAQNKDLLFQLADKALYVAKGSGRNNSKLAQLTE